MRISAARATRALIRALPGRMSIPILLGPATGIRIPSALAEASPAILFGRYETAVTKAILSVRTPVHVAYDVGAHIGLTTTILATAFGKDTQVTAFEPAPENLALLSAVLKLNPRLKIQIAPVAVSDRPGAVAFRRHRASSMGLLADIAQQDGQQFEDDQVQQVNATSLDVFVLDEGNRAPQFVKIDVEGAEALVLSGARQVLALHHPTLLIELHGPIHAREAYAELARHDYKWQYICPQGSTLKELSDSEQLLQYFGPGLRWTQHVLLT